VAPAAYYAAQPVHKLVRTQEAEPFDLHPQYQYSYSVHDSVTADIKTQEESRDGDLVRGSYSIVEPDGTLRTVTYTAGNEGFNAVVDRQPGYAPAAPVYHAKKVIPTVYSAPAPVFNARKVVPATYSAPAPIYRSRKVLQAVPVHHHQPAVQYSAYAAPVATVVQPTQYAAVPHAHYYAHPNAVIPVQHHTQIFPQFIAHPAQAPASVATTPAPQENNNIQDESAPVATPAAPVQTTTTQRPQPQVTFPPQPQPGPEDSQSDDAIIVESRSASDNSQAEDSNSNGSNNSNVGTPAKAAEDGSSSFSYTSSGKQYNFSVAY